MAGGTKKASRIRQGSSDTLAATWEGINREEDFRPPRAGGDDAGGMLVDHYHRRELPASLSCGDGEALLDYDPTAGTSTVLLGPTVNCGSIVDALVYPGYE